MSVGGRIEQEGQDPAASVRPGGEPSAAMCRMLIEHTADIPYYANLQGELIFIGHQISRYGLDPARVLAEGVMSFVAPEDQERVARDIERTMTTGETFPTAFRIVRPDGGVCWLEDHGQLAQDDSGEVVGLIGFLRDITERREAQEAQRTSEERLRDIAERITDGIFELDLDGRVTYASPAMERMSGWTQGEVLGTDYRSHVLEGERAALIALWARLVQGEEIKGLQVGLRNKDGGAVITEINAALVRTKRGERAILGTVRDVTARMQLESQMRQMQKMEAIGTLAGGVAHDFNNLLLGILGYASHLKRITDAADEVHEAAAVIEQAAERAAELTKQLLGFARQGKLHNQPLNVHQLVGELGALLRRTLDRRVEIVQRLAAPAQVVNGDQNQLLHALLNLGLNAGQAIAGAGRICFESTVVDIAPASAQSPPELHPGRHLLLSVSDTGAGIPPDQLDRVFEPFFTTKPPGQGSGMGLAMAYGIIRNHEGAIRVHSELGVGSTFEIWLPLVEQQVVDERAGPLAVEATLAASGTVLLVEDEIIARKVATMMLSKLGYQVLVAGNGEEAVAQYEAHRGAVKLVLLDLLMPVMDGYDCYQALRVRDPEVKVLLATGHAMDGKFQRLIAGGVPVIRKPYGLPALAKAIEGALRSR